MRARALEATRPGRDRTRPHGGGTGSAVRLRAPGAMSPPELLHLQRTAGNSAVQRLVGGALRIGSRGPEVVALQQKLNAAGASLTPDGAFGGRTQQAVVAFQRAAGLGADGVVGPQTNAALAAGTVHIGRPAAAASGGGGGGAAGADPRLQTLGGLLQAIKNKLADRGPAATAGPPELTKPETRTGLFDDAADWVEDQVESAAETAGQAADWVEDKAGAAADWVEDKAEAAADWAGEQASAAGQAVSDAAGAAADWAGEQANAAGEAVSGAAGWVGDQASAAGEAVTEAAAKAFQEAKQLASDVQGLVGEAVSELGEKGAKLLELLGGLTSETKPSSASLDDLISQASSVLAGLTSDAEELKTGAGAGTLDFKPVAGSDPNFVFTSATFPELRALLTARTQEAGSATPSAPVLTLNGTVKPPATDEKVKSAKVSVIETVQLPSWTNADSPSVQDEQKAEWKRYVGAMSAHEQLHVSDDRGIYEKMAASLPGKTFAEAYKAADDATDAGNAQGPARDASDKAPTLMPAGVEKQ